MKAMMMMLAAATLVFPLTVGCTVSHEEKTSTNPITGTTTHQEQTVTQNPVDGSYTVEKSETKN
jgi:hypothetical protein